MGETSQDLLQDPHLPVVDLKNCDREPIHILGAIQPFGLLIAVTADWLVARASANLAEFLGKTPEQALGGQLEALLSPQALHDIRNMATMLREADAVERGFAMRLDDSQALYDVAVHFAGALLVIEAEPAAGERGDAAALVRGMMTRVRQVQSTGQFLQMAARHVRSLTGFDRVMVYRFDASGAGEVVAEARRAGVDSFLGLNYPASDIPVQARILYTRNIFRVIADVNAAPVPIVPQLDPEGAPLDLSLSVLRAVSPIHIEYLRNMGVGASLSISIIVEGKLWGLFACHHYAPRRPGYLERTTAELFGSMFSLMLESRERQAIAEYESKARSVADRLMTVVAQSAARLQDAEWLGSIVADAIPAEGVGVFTNGVIALSGLTPTEAQFRGIVTLLNRAAASRVFTTDHLTGLLPEASLYAERAAGLLAIPLSRSPRDYVVLFRPERLRNVRWAGNPEKPIEYGPNGARLTPRKSFEEWSELVKGKAAPFGEAELRVAETLRGTLLEVILRLSDEAGAERARAEERQTLLIAELNHRVRNILALIRGLLGQSRQNARDPVEMLENLDNRILSLARAHDQITIDHWGASGLRGLIETEAAAFLGAKHDRLSVVGDDVRLQPEAFTVLALVVHELVTNAAKYGALSDNGIVRISWQRDAQGDLELSWREQGGPAVTAPKRRGFGSTIIERSIPHELGGRATLRHRVTGLEADFCVPARYVTAPAPVAAAPKPAPAPALPEYPPLRGLSVLLVEDSLMIALDCETALGELGARDVHVAPDLRAAEILLASTEFGFAVLDLNLGRETSLPLADLLAARGTPFIFATGYGEAGILPPAHERRLTVTKPYTAADLGRAARRTLQPV